MDELEARGALDPDEAAHARAESADTEAIGNEVLKKIPRPMSGRGSALENAGQHGYKKATGKIPPLKGGDAYGAVPAGCSGSGVGRASGRHHLPPLAVNESAAEKWIFRRR